MTEYEFTKPDGSKAYEVCDGMPDVHRLRRMHGAISAIPVQHTAGRSALRSAIDNPVSVHCATCNSENVKRDAHAEWNPELQIWELSNTYDDFFCDDCGHDVSTYERAIEAETTK